MKNMYVIFKNHVDNVQKQLIKHIEEIQLLNIEAFDGVAKKLEEIKETQKLIIEYLNIEIVKEKKKFIKKQ